MKTLALFRPPGKMGPSAALAEARGYRVLRVPLLSIEPLDDPRWAPFVDDLARGRWHWLVFTSTTGVELVLERLRRTPAAAAALASTRVAAIGDATATRLAAGGVPVALVPTATTSEGIAAALGPEAGAGRRVALLRSAQGSPALARALASLGAEVLDLPVYRLGPPPDPAALAAFFAEASAGGVDAFAFTSRLTVLHLLGAARGRGAEEPLLRALARGVVGALGGPTAAALASRGIRVDVVPARARFPDLLEGIDAALRSRRGPADAPLV